MNFCFLKVEIGLLGYLQSIAMQDLIHISPELKGDLEVASAVKQVGD
jgi:hypothetical protein